LLRGRFFNQHDLAGGAPVIIVNETAANHFWPKQNPIGKHIAGSRDLVPKEVVGVVADAKSSALNAADAEQLYVPAEQMPYPTMTIVVRSTANPESLAMRCISGFAGFALFLAAIGMYGVMAYSVTQRKQEMGIRIALGAAPGDILRPIVRQGMTLVIAGVVLGVLASLALTRLVASLLFGVGPSDPLIFTSAALVLISAASAACYVPARRGTRVDPIVVLRSE
jgi:putative ABC transport system permease protein